MAITNRASFPLKPSRAFRLAILVAIPAGLMTGALVASQVRAAQPPGAAITIDNFTFTPGEMTVPVGTVVTWTDHDDIPHSIVAKDRAFRSAALDTDQSFAFTFTTAGTFEYFCGLHPHMTGKVIVTP